MISGGIILIFSLESLMGHLFIFIFFKFIINTSHIDWTYKYHSLKQHVEVLIIQDVFPWCDEYDHLRNRRIKELKKNSIHKMAKGFYKP